MMENIGRLMVLAGIIIVICGVLLLLGGKFFGLGKLPGDLFIQKGNFTFYFPIATCILLSILLTIIFSLFRR
ncbi:MAG: DUF2905 domain-containing protein [Peptococcaceae bacterium]|nr:DUF2905 domain-containing protein [Peptococcaceae bacterium]